MRLIRETGAIMMTNDEIRKKWAGKATWFIGDKCPIGQRVKFRLGADEEYKHGVIVGEYTPPGPHHCLSCSCPPRRDDPFIGWWMIVLDQEYRFKIADFGYFGTEQNPVGRLPMEIEPE